MIAQELIQHLKTLPPNTKILLRGYEDGYNDIFQLKSVKIKPKADANWYDGEYEDSTDVGATLAGDLYGENQNPTNNLK